jgi:hypothetical protein
MGASPSKFSFHNSGICREAFTKESGHRPIGSSDRVLQKWVRTPLPLAGENKAQLIFSLQIPTGYLSRSSKQYPKKVEWIAADSSSSSVIFHLLLSNEVESAVSRGLLTMNPPFRLIKTGTFGDGRLIGLSYGYQDWENKTLVIKGDGKVNDIVISHLDPFGVGRPLRVTQQRTRGKDENHAPSAIEYGAFPNEADLPNTDLAGIMINFNSPA